MKITTIISLTALSLAGLAFRAQASVALIDHSQSIAVLQSYVTVIEIQQGELQLQNQLLGGNVVEYAFAISTLDETLYHVNLDITALENDQTPFAPGFVPSGDPIEAIVVLQMELQDLSIQSGQLQLQNQLLGGNVSTYQFAIACLSETAYHVNLFIGNLGGTTSANTVMATPEIASAVVTVTTAPVAKASRNTGRFEQ